MRECSDEPKSEVVPGYANVSADHPLAGARIEAPDPANPKDVIGLKKTPLRLFPPVALVYGAEVMRHGAAKYGEYNWRDHSIKLSAYLEAAMRHILQAADGEVQDVDSQLPHVAHAMMCMAIILDAQDNGMLLLDLPPRETKGTLQGLMEGLTSRRADPT